MGDIKVGDHVYKVERTPPIYTAEGHRALLQAVNEFYNDGSEAAYLILARAAELTAQSVERESPAKDGGEQDAPYVPNLGEDCRECGYQICRCVDAQHVAADTYIAAVNGRREFRAAYRKALAVVLAARPFAKIITESSGRIPTERLSLADWHELSKAMKGIDDAQPLASQNNGAWHFETDHNDSGETIGITIFDHDKRVTTFVCAGCEQDYRFANEICHAHNLASQMRPQSAVQGWVLVPLDIGERLGEGFLRALFDSQFDTPYAVRIHSLISTAPQPPQGEG